MAEIGNNYTKNDKLIKIKSKYIVIKIFENLNQHKLLDIIHYNKKYQKVMEKKLKDYKYESFKIVIEIIPEENIYGNFINISKENIRKNIHIYFNDYQEEIKTKIINKDDNVTKIKIIINHKVKSLSKLFYNCECIKKINFIKFNRDDIKNMSYIFCGCTSLNELNLSNFNTNNVTDMSGMFYGCLSLKELNLFNFNTNSVTNMSNMFNRCTSLQELDISNFNTNNVTNFTCMFPHSEKLKT